MKRKLKITITKTHRRIMSTAPPILRTVCSSCGQEVEMLTAAESIRILEIENSMFQTLVETGKIHTTETVSGDLRVCKESLFK